MPRSKKRVLSRKKAVRKRKKPSWTVIRKHNKRRPPSSIEITIRQWLEEDGIKFKREKAIGRCHVDFFFEPKTVLEIQGCFWHACTLCNKALTKTQKAAQVKDAKRFGFIRSKGYDIITIWEHEIHNEPEKVRSLLNSIKG